MQVKTPLLLIGGGGHCHSCIDVIEATADYEIVGIVEADGATPDPRSPYPIVGYDADLPELLKQTPHCLITLGQIKNAVIRQNMFAQLKFLGAQLPTIISPFAQVSSRAKIGEGSIVMHQALVNSYAHIGDNCIINSQCLVEHDCSISDHTHIATGAKVNGQVTIGKNCFIGSNAVIKQGLTITDNTIIGAAGLVLVNIEQAAVYTGVIK